MNVRMKDFAQFTTVHAADFAATHTRSGSGEVLRDPARPALAYPGELPCIRHRAAHQLNGGDVIPRGQAPCMSLIPRIIAKRRLTQPRGPSASARGGSETNWEEENL